ncbi:hypothetical protein Trco_000526 [Trichoderma cornu-damae]|uniref:Uncharacterized protein n=1 Tax=Trichoderma cornu-damae TaxID=654480 RepID=A0A9P8TWE9_9HYPO|nr:hypothetical protein Trco_000526 [Trichoderma cornu-damae]
MAVIQLASLYFGTFIGVFVFAFAKIIHQTHTIWTRTRSLLNAYLFFIWIEALVNLIWAVITYLYLCGIIPESLSFFLGTVILWAIQTQLLPQIIANRVSLILTNHRTARNLKLGLAIVIGCVNGAVFYIWTVAQLPTASRFQVVMNNWSEHIEKSFFLIVDLALNLYFLYLVRFRLIQDGLNKYWKLFNFNVGIVFLSTSMDILLLGFLSLPDHYLYIQFAPLAYIVKLYIELLMAILISKIVRSNTNRRPDLHNRSTNHNTTDPTNHVTSRVVITGPAPKADDGLARQGSSGSEVCLTTYNGDNGIMRTIETTVVVYEAEDSHSSIV